MSFKTAHTAGGRNIVKQRLDNNITSGFRHINKPTVSIIIPNWNGKLLLGDCLKSLQQLTYPNYELIVVDNGSTDESSEMVRKEFPTTKVVQSPTNLGFAGACNLGIRAALGDIIALFNNDATVEPSWLSKLVKIICQDDEIALVSGLVFYDTPSDVLWSAGARIDGITGNPYHLGRGERFHPIDRLEDLDYLPGCGIIFRRMMVDKVGVFDENYFLYCEEIDWTFLAKRMGYKIVLDTSALVWHKASATRRKNPSRGYYYRMRGLFRLYFKHFPLKYLLTSLFFQLFIFPILEALIFRTSALYIQQRMNAFFWNISKLRELLVERKKASLLGDLELKNRFREFLAVTKRHISSKSYDF